MSAPNVEEVEISSLVIDAAFQVRKAIHPTTVDRYVTVLKNDVMMPPVSVVRVRNTGSAPPRGRPIRAVKALTEGTLLLIDGFHRVRAHMELGRTTITAKVIEASKYEVLGLVSAVNHEHGLPMRGKELKNSLRAFLLGRRHVKASGELMSYREIAKAMGGSLSYWTVRDWVRRYHPALFERMRRRDDGGDGGLRSEKDAAPVDAGTYLHDSARQTLLNLRNGAGLLTPEQRGEQVADLGETRERLRVLPTAQADY